MTKIKAHLLSILIMIPYGLFIMMFRLIVGMYHVVRGIIENIAEEYEASVDNYLRK